MAKSKIMGIYQVPEFTDNIEKFKEEAIKYVQKLPKNILSFSIRTDLKELEKAIQKDENKRFPTLFEERLFLLKELAKRL